MLGPVSLQQVLEVVAEFDDSGGASLGLVAWELCIDEELVAPAWQRAITERVDQARRSRLAGAVVAARFRRLGNRSKRAPKILSRQLHEQERVGSKADRIARKLPLLQVRSHNDG